MAFVALTSGWGLNIPPKLTLSPMARSAAKPKAGPFWAEWPGINGQAIAQRNAKTPRVKRRENSGQ